MIDTTTATVDAPELATAKPDNPQNTANLRWIWRFVMMNRLAVYGAIGCGMIAGLTASLEPYLIGVIIDRITERGGAVAPVVALRDGFIPLGMPPDIAPLIVLMLGLAGVTVIAFYGQRYFSGEIAYRVNFEIRKVLFDNLLTLEHRFYQQYSTGDLISRMHADIVLIWRLLALTFTRLGSAVMTVIITFVLLATVSIPLTLIVFLVLTVSTSLQIAAGFKLVDMFERVQDQVGKLSAMVQDSISGIRTIKTAGREAGAAQAHFRESVEYRRRWLFFKRRNEPVGMLPNMISDLTRASVVLFGGILTVNGSLTIGNFAQFLIYLTMISQVLLQIGTVYQRLQQTRGALTRITPLLQDATIRDEPQARSLTTMRGDIQFENVGLRIGDKWLLRDINLSIPAGIVVAVVGPTGCGKTLLVNMLSRVHDPTDGRVIIDSLDIRQLKLSDLRNSIAYVPQSTFLFSQELHRNVRMGRDYITDDELNRSVSISRVSNDLKQLPQGLDTLVGEKGVMLSGGQKQRVAIARAIVRDPSILILDDALSSVDMHTASDILSELRGVLRTRTSFIIAHRIATVKDADMIIVMDEGRIVEQGSHDELVQQNGAYARMVNRELADETIRYVD